MDKTVSLREAASLLASLARLAALVAAAVVLTKSAWTEGPSPEFLDHLLAVVAMF